jgi:hypothetical protein
MPKETPLETLDILTLDGYAVISVSWVKHNSVTNSVRSVCSCVDCELFRRVAIDDLLGPKVPFLKMFVSQGGTAEELRRYYEQ